MAYPKKRKERGILRNDSENASGTGGACLAAELRTATLAERGRALP
jgi:hypothetical protein